MGLQFGCCRLQQLKSIPCSSVVSVVVMCVKIGHIVCLVSAVAATFA